MESKVKVSEHAHLKCYLMRLKKILFCSIQMKVKMVSTFSVLFSEKLLEKLYGDEEDEGGEGQTFTETF